MFFNHLSNFLFFLFRFGNACYAYDDTELVVWLQSRNSELQQVQAKASSNEGVLRDCRADLNLKKNEMDDLRHQLKQGLTRVYGQVTPLSSPPSLPHSSQTHPPLLVSHPCFTTPCRPRLAPAHPSRSLSLLASPD